MAFIVPLYYNNQGFTQDFFFEGHSCVFLVSFPDPTSPSLDHFQYCVWEGGSSNVSCFDGMCNYGITCVNKQNYGISKFSVVPVVSAVFEVLLPSSLLRSSSNLTISQ